MKFFSVFLALAISRSVLAVRHYDIVNNCPFSATIYINGQSQGSLPALGGKLARDYPENWSGLIYTDLNQGNPEGPGTARAGFYGQSNYYYIVRDPNWINVDVNITPINRAPKGGFCLSVDCKYNSCPDSYTSPPTAFPPPASGVPPASPLHSCPQAETGYTVTFCPTGELPNYQSRPNFINPGENNPNKCLDVRGNVQANGTPVQIYDCNGSGAQRWSILRGNTTVRLSGTDFCLDAGSTPGNGIGMKIWKCYDNLPAQQWYYTDDNRIALAGKGLCLDLTNGVLINGNKVQTWQCTDNNPNQVWH
ncbi:Extracellular exo-alpha-L-arabinofuranosidase [Hypsizygus marmoreus]|uniref:Extracellular exo-alpha-L-arabinofuranosidase n=1 Tax=Hypsizygus marmoreus TaxID=39966 RepID=A0A369JCM2_HYPMA|nr:Extracellular exo-alpha-L-arabinofuranosidase [Hypsizygus marmoreus]